MHRSLYLFALLLCFSCGTTAPATTSSDSGAPSPQSRMSPAEQMNKETSFAGTWAVTVSDTPMGTVNGDLMLKEAADGSFSGTFTTSEGELKLKSATRTNDGMKVVFYLDTYNTDIDINLKGKPGDAILSGQTMSQFTTLAKRKMR